MPEITASDDTIAAIAKLLGEDVSKEQIGQVLSAWNNTLGGDPVGTLRRDPESGGVAHRVDADGVHLWRVSFPDGNQYNDLQPTLPWPQIG
jgi:hypothetical protein